MDYDQTEIASTYKQGRDHGPEFLRQWMDVVAAHVDTQNVRTVLDLGCGTGRFSQGLAARLNAKVVGLDPSRKMLSEARKDLSDPRVFYACGSAEEMPMRDDSIDVIFISMAFHHFTNPNGVALQCRRILREGGRVCLRTASRERIGAYPYVPFFPASIPLLEQRLPSLQFQSAVFQSAGFRVVFSGEVRQQIATDYAEYAEKLATKSDSVLVSLKDQDFDEGIARVRAQKDSGPIVEPIDFVVFE
ncbi:MAG TPA: methyltransferase domain-containing protein [Terriglobia bacterium]|nr:methyltransferase domain-containing protein [Terriglobia bacterium]